VVGIAALEGVRFGGGQVLNALLGLEVVFHPVIVPVGVVPQEGVAGIAVHVAVGARRAPVREENRDLVDRFGRQREEIPEHVGVLQVGDGVALLGVDKIGEFDGIPDEKDRGVVPHHVVVAFLGVKLDRKPARVAFGIGGTLLAAHGGKAHKDFRLFARFREERRPGVLAHIGGCFKVAVCACALGMHHALRDALPVEVRQFFQQVNILHQYRTRIARGQAVLVIADRLTKAGR